MTDRVKPAAKQVGSHAQHRARRPYYRRLKLRHVAVPASITVEAELIPAICGKIVVVVNKLNHSHRKESY